MPEFAAIYTRVSSEEQAQRNTIQSQIDLLRRYAETYSLTVAKEYIDDGVSGRLPLAKRPAGVQLLKDAAQKRFQKLLVYRLDRLGRTQKIILDEYERLEAFGVTLISATEKYDASTPTGKLVFQMLGSISELEKSTIAERTILGRDTRLKNGNYRGGQFPMGYGVDEAGQVILIEPDASIAHEIFENIANGSTTIQECKRLNARMSPTRQYGHKKHISGTKWYPNRISKMIHNPIYRGTRIYKSKRGIIEQSVPALVSEELWNKAGQRLTQNRNLSKSPNARDYFLRGILKCASCGLSYVGQGHMDSKQRFYRCTGRARHKRAQDIQCTGKAIQAEKIERLVWAECIKAYQYPDEFIERARQRLLARRKAESHTAQKEITLLREIAKKGEERERVKLMFQRGFVNYEELEKRYADIEQEENTLQDELRSIYAHNDVTNTLDRYLQSAENMLKKWKLSLAALTELSDADPERTYQKKCLRELVSKVVVDTSTKPAQVHIYFILMGARKLNIEENGSHSERPCYNASTPGLLSPGQHTMVAAPII